MARKSTFYLMFMLLGIFLLGLLVITGIASQQHIFGDGDENTQDLNAEETNATVEETKPIVLGMDGLIKIFLAIFFLAGIGIFVKLLFGKRRSRDL